MDDVESGGDGDTSDKVSDKVGKVDDRNIAEQSRTRTASGGFVEEMLNAGIVTTTDKFKKSLANKSKNISEEDKLKITEMVKGLSRFNEEDFDGSDLLDVQCKASSVRKNKKSSKSPRKSESDSKETSLHEFLDSEIPEINKSASMLKAKNDSASTASNTKSEDELVNKFGTLDTSLGKPASGFKCSKPADTEVPTEYFVSNPTDSINLTRGNKNETRELGSNFVDLKTYLRPETMSAKARIDTSMSVPLLRNKKTPEKQGKKKVEASPVDGKISKSAEKRRKAKQKAEEADYENTGGEGIGSYSLLLQKLGNRKQGGVAKQQQSSPPKLSKKEKMYQQMDEELRQKEELDVYGREDLQERDGVVLVGQKVGKKKKKEKKTPPTERPVSGKKNNEKERNTQAWNPTPVMDKQGFQDGPSPTGKKKRNKKGNMDPSQPQNKQQNKQQQQFQQTKQQQKQNKQQQQMQFQQNYQHPQHFQQNQPRQQFQQNQGPQFQQQQHQTYQQQFQQNSARLREQEQELNNQLEQQRLILQAQQRLKDQQHHPPLNQVLGPDSCAIVSVNVRKSEHKYIVGKQRKHLQDIYDITGVIIDVPPVNEEYEEIQLRGDKLQLGPAMALMFSKSAQAQNEALLTQGARPKDVIQPTSHVQVKGHPQVQPYIKGQGHKKQGSSSSSVCSVEMEGSDFKFNFNQNQNANDKNSENLPTQNTRYVYPTQNRGQGQPGQGQGQSKGHGGQSSARYEKYVEIKSHQSEGDKFRTPDKNYVRSTSQTNTPKSQGKRQRKKKCLFSDYMPMDEVSQGLKRGTLIQGPVRINPKNFEEAYVPHPDGCSDVIICTLKERNRALNGDIVAIELYQEDDWKLNKEELQRLEEDLNVSKTSDDPDSDPEMVIESEEIIEIKPSHNPDLQGVADDMNNLKIATNQNTSGSTNQSPQKKGGYESPKKRFTSLKDVLAEGSPEVKKLFKKEGNKDQAKKMLQRTGKVVAILEKKHSRACTGHIKPFQDRKDKVLFCPSDHRMPRMMVDSSGCPKDFFERSEDHARTLYVGRLTDWRHDSNYADGCLAKSLGEAGEIEPETEGMLIENGIDFDEFPQEMSPYGCKHEMCVYSNLRMLTALDCLPQQNPWSIPASEYEYRRDYRSACVFTIDPATARDLDDALSCEVLGDGRYKVGVHIADVSYFLDENTVLDRVAALRATSVYLVHKVIPMLPRLLCEQLCSLNPDVDRLTLTVEWTITQDGKIEDEWFGRSVIRSCAKLAYDHAQGFIEHPEKEWTTDELPRISKGFCVEDIKTRVLNLQKLAVQLRKGRMESGALRLDQVKLQYTLDKESGMPNGYWVYQQKDSNRLVEEFMLLANMAVAHRLNKMFPDKALLRRHPPPQEKMVENLRDQCSALGIHIDITSAGSIQRSLSNYYGNDDNSMARMQVLVALCSKPMQNAKYFCTGCIDDESLYKHYALNVPLYTHFTSPIRRYPDCIVHRLLAASLEYTELTSRSPQELHKMAENCNDKKTAAKRVGDLSSELFFAVFVKTAGPLEEKAMVMGVLDKAFDIFVLKLGVSKRVYCDKLEIREKLYRRERKVPSLTLIWPEVNGEPEIRQELTIFSVVDCVLKEGDQPLQWTATIKKPQPMSYIPAGVQSTGQPMSYIPAGVHNTGQVNDEGNEDGTSENGDKDDADVDSDVDVDDGINEDREVDISNVNIDVKTET